MSDIPTNGKEVLSALELIVDSPNRWLLEIGEGVDEHQLSQFFLNPYFLAVDKDPKLAELVMHHLILDRLLMAKRTTQDYEIFVWGKDDIDLSQKKYSLAYIGDIDEPIRIGNKIFSQDELIDRLTALDPHIRIVRPTEIMEVAKLVRAGRSTQEISAEKLLETYGPLKILAVSDDINYTQAASDFFSGIFLGEKRLFNVKTATKKTLDEVLSTGAVINLGEYCSDIILFDLSENKPFFDQQQLPLLNRYLSRNQTAYTIVAITDAQWNELSKRTDWITLQREVIGTPALLTQSIRQPAQKKSKEDLVQYFSHICDELLYQTFLPVLWDLKNGLKTIRRRIVSLPAEYVAFSQSIRSEPLSDLAARSMDIIKGWNPDDALKMLRELQPKDDEGHSVPQHCYPPFGRLKGIGQEEIIPLIVGRGSPLDLYLHLPFCVNACTYCDYTTITGATPNAQKEYLDALKQEMQNIYNLTKWDVVSPQSLNIGGGTPSLLSPELIKELGQFLRTFFDLGTTRQITFEVSPETVSAEKLIAFKDDVGATRASIGLQSIADEVSMSWWKRFYSVRKGMKGVEELMKLWPHNTNIDIMFGFPVQTLRLWEDDLDAAISLNVPSITFYELRVSPRTRFVKGQQFPNEYTRMLMYVMAVEKFLNNGFKQTSDNQVVKSPQNQVYVYKDAKKRGGNVLGIGLSSYSIFTGNSTMPGIIYFNMGGRDPREEPREFTLRYHQAVKAHKFPAEIGMVMDPKEQMRFYMVQGLKLSGIGKEANGADSAEFVRRFGQTIQNAFPHTERLIENGLLESKGNYLGLTYKGLAFESLVLKTYFN